MSADVHIRPRQIGKTDAIHRALGLAICALLEISRNSEDLPDRPNAYRGARWRKVRAFKALEEIDKLLPGSKP